MNITGASIVRIALIGEGALVLLSLPLLLLPSSFAHDSWSARSALYGAGATLPLLALSFGMSEAIEGSQTLKHSRFGTVLREFHSECILPLCLALTPWQAFLIGVLSGLGEELFFRGLLTTLSNLFMPEVGTLLLVNFLFALVHFIGQVRRFALLLPLYTTAGLYFSALAIFSDSLLAPIVCHGLFNFCSILINKRKALRSRDDTLT